MSKCKFFSILVSKVQCYSLDLFVNKSKVLFWGLKKGSRANKAGQHIQHAIFAHSSMCYKGILKWVHSMIGICNMHLSTIKHSEKFLRVYERHLNFVNSACWKWWGTIINNCQGFTLGPLWIVEGTVPANLLKKEINWHFFTTKLELIN